MPTDDDTPLPTDDTPPPVVTDLPKASDLPARRPAFQQRDDLARARARCTLVFSLTLCVLLLLGPLLEHGVLYDVLSWLLVAFAVLTLAYRILLKRRYERSRASS
jgi:Flp pilus assembly protein TadB